GIERVGDFPRLGRGDDGARALGLEHHAEVARAPEVARGLVAAALLHGIEDVLDRVARDPERGGRTVHAEPEPRELGAREDLVPIAQDREAVEAREGVADRTLVWAKVNRRAQP